MISLTANNSKRVSSMLMAYKSQETIKEEDNASVIEKGGGGPLDQSPYDARIVSQHPSKDSMSGKDEGGLNGTPIAPSISANI